MDGGFVTVILRTPPVAHQCTLLFEGSYGDAVSGVLEFQ
jgi:hypothetical protein